MMPKGGVRSYLLRFLGITIGCGAAVFMTGCAYVDSVGPRAVAVNRSMTDYRNEATLLNIIRAKYNEPMDFVALTGATGHSTFNSSQGLPTFIVGPHTAPTATNPVVARNYVFGPNSMQESAGTDFNVSLLDDPQSYAALMTPIDASMVGFFLGRRWKPHLLLPLLVSEVRIVPDNGNVVLAFYSDPDPNLTRFAFCQANPRDQTKYSCCPPEAAKNGRDLCKPRTFTESPQTAWMFDECRAGRAFCVTPIMLLFYYLADRGFTVQIPVGAIPGQQQQAPPPARICFDPVYSGDSEIKTFASIWAVTFGLDVADVNFLKEKEWRDDYGYIEKKTSPKLKNYNCDNVPWSKPSVAQSNAQSANGANGAARGGAADAANGPARGGAAGPNKKLAGGNSADLPMYEIYDEKSKATIQLFFRSTWGIYSFLGHVVQRQETEPPVRMLGPGFQGDRYLFRVIEDGQAGCFTSVAYSDKSYCIPKDANNSKMILSLLHELANLYTKPNSNQQLNSGTARITN